MNRSIPIIFVGGLLFGFGLAFSTMVQPEVVLRFLTFDDLGLALVMGAALVVCVPIYQLAPRLMQRPILGGAFDSKPRRIAPSAVVGGVIFGVGWGISGVCPGAAVGSLGVGNWPIFYALAGILIGAAAQGFFASRGAGTAGRTPAQMSTG